MKFLLYAFVLGLLVSCAGAERPAPQTDVRGLAGKRAEDVEVLFSKAHVLWKGDVCADPQEAIHLLDEVIAKDGEYAEAWAWRGLARSELGKREEAFDDLTMAVRLEPSAVNYAFRALVSLRGGGLTAARRDAEYSLRMNGKQHMAWNVLGAAALREEDTQTACANFAKACSSGNCDYLEKARSEGVCK